MIRKLLYCCLLSTFLQATHGEFRLSTGPAWHEFYAVERFFFDPVIDTIDVEMFEELKFDLMAYMDAQARMYIGNSFNVHGTYAGGFLQKGEMAVNHYVPIDATNSLQFVRESTMDVAITTLDINVGAQCCLHKRLLVNPFVGYVFNLQTLDIVNFSNAHDNAQFYNSWRGSYIGLEGVFAFSDCFIGKAFYKHVFANFRADITFNLSPIKEIIIPHAHNEQWKAQAFGNIFCFELLYNYHNHWHIGSAVTVAQYDNHADGFIIMQTPIANLTQTRLKKVLWNQVAWTFFVEIDF